MSNYNLKIDLSLVKILHIMGSKEDLRNLLGREPTPAELAQDIADRISSQEDGRRAARMSGDVGQMRAHTEMISQLKHEALTEGLTPDTHPGLFR